MWLNTHDWECMVAADGVLYVCHQGICKYSFNVCPYHIVTHQAMHCWSYGTKWLHQLSSNRILRCRRVIFVKQGEQNEVFTPFSTTSMGAWMEEYCVNNDLKCIKCCLKVLQKTLLNTNAFIHRNENITETKFSSLAALEVVILTTSNAASCKNFITIKTFWCQCMYANSSLFNVSRSLCIYDFIWCDNRYKRIHTFTFIRHRVQCKTCGTQVTYLRRWTVLTIWNWTVHWNYRKTMIMDSAPYTVCTALLCLLLSRL